MYRDLKPDNVLISQKGDLLLTDFEFAVHLHLDSQDLALYYLLFLGKFFEFDFTFLKNNLENLNKKFWSEGTIFTERFSLFLDSCDEGDLKKMDFLFSKEKPPETTKFGKKFLSKKAKVGIKNEAVPETNGQISSTKQDLQIIFTKTPIVGSLEYMSPEVLQSKMYSLSSDLWALGCLIFDVYYRRTLFRSPPPDLTEQQKKQFIQKNIFKLKVCRENQEKMSEEAFDLFEKLVRWNPYERLGVHGIQEVLEHPWLKKETISVNPYLPVFQFQSDVVYLIENVHYRFVEEFDRESLCLQAKNKKTKGTRYCLKPFRIFQKMKPSSLDSGAKSCRASALPINQKGNVNKINLKSVLNWSKNEKRNNLASFLDSNKNKSKKAKTTFSKKLNLKKTNIASSHIGTTNTTLIKKLNFSKFSCKEKNRKKLNKVCPFKKKFITLNKKYNRNFYSNEIKKKSNMASNFDLVPKYNKMPHKKEKIISNSRHIKNLKKKILKINKNLIKKDNSKIKTNRKKITLIPKIKQKEKNLRKKDDKKTKRRQKNKTAVNLNSLLISHEVKSFGQQTVQTTKHKLNRVIDFDILGVTKEQNKKKIEFPTNTDTVTTVQKNSLPKLNLVSTNLSNLYPKNYASKKESNFFSFTLHQDFSTKLFNKFK